MKFHYLQYSVWNVLWIGWNTFIICFYLNIGPLDRVSIYFLFFSLNKNLLLISIDLICNQKYFIVFFKVPNYGNFQYFHIYLFSNSFSTHKSKFATYVCRKQNKRLFVNSKGSKMRTTALIMSIKYVLTFLRFQLQLP